MSIIDNSLFDPSNVKGTSNYTIKIAKIASVNSNDTTATVQFDGESVAGLKYYKSLSSYIPKEGDRVLLIGVSGSYIILGAF